MLNIEFVWWGGGRVCTVLFMSNTITVLRLCCVVVGVVKIEDEVVLKSCILFFCGWVGGWMGVVWRNGD